MLKTQYDEFSNTKFENSEENSICTIVKVSSDKIFYESKRVGGLLDCFDYLQESIDSFKNKIERGIYKIVNKDKEDKEKFSIYNLPKNSNDFNAQFGKTNIE